MTIPCREIDKETGLTKLRAEKCLNHTYEVFKSYLTYHKISILKIAAKLSEDNLRNYKLTEGLRAFRGHPI